MPKLRSPFACAGHLNHWVMPKHTSRQPETTMHLEHPQHAWETIDKLTNNRLFLETTFCLSEVTILGMSCERV